MGRDHCLSGGGKEAGAIRREKEGKEADMGQTAQGFGKRKLEKQRGEKTKGQRNFNATPMHLFAVFHAVFATLINFYAVLYAVFAVLKRHFCRSQ